MDENRIDAFERIRLMFDGESSMILGITNKGPLTASQISRRLHMPRSVCYRKLKRLVEARLLAEGKIGNIWANGAGVTCYISNIEKAFVALEHGEMRMTLKLKDQDGTMSSHLAPFDSLS